MTTKVVVIDCEYSSSPVEVPFSDKYDFEVGDMVVFKDEEGKEEAGVIRKIDCDSVDSDKVLFSSRILRKATPNDLQKIEGSSSLSKDGLAACKKIVKTLGLEMNVFRCKYSFDGSKVHFLFTAEDRVDFRELVKELAKTLQKQIHLRQLGPRDKARLVGGFGKCGQPLCCGSWLEELESVGMDMVRVQGLEGKGGLKLSGSCGKLLCCLKYEVELYRSLKKDLPKMGAKVKVKGRNTEGVVCSLDVLNQKIKVFFERDDFSIVGPDDIEKSTQNSSVKK
jgi:cell fate regulator YaaT (PSP1 superfamily)